MLEKLSRRRGLCWSAIALSVILGRIALLPWLPPPDPSIHDEFSYLLAADTFAHGRAANPALRHPEFFESPQVLPSPVYLSKYPPGQGLVLALGQLLTEDPYWGVVLSVAATIFLFCWAANAWLPPQWTLIAGILSVPLFFVRDYWLSSYWGGALAAAGGALVVGGLGYVLRGNLKSAGLSLGLGGIVLYAARPYEGGILCLATLALLAWHVFQLRPERMRRTVFRIVLPNAVLLLAAIPVALWYNASVTGNALEMPYTLYQRHASLTTQFWVQPLPPPKQYSSRHVAAYNRSELEQYWSIRNKPLLSAVGMQLGKFVFHGLIGPFMGFAFLLLGAPWARIRYKKHLLFLFVAGGAALVPELWVKTHYAAPFRIVHLILIAACGRALWFRLAAATWGRPIRRIALALLIAPFFLNYQSPTAGANERTVLATKLTSQGGRHLVFVDYAPGWDYLNEWVYNGADLDSALVVFAHDLGNERNRVLAADYAERTPWRVLLGPGPADVHIERYPAEPLQTPGSACCLTAPR